MQILPALLAAAVATVSFTADLTRSAPVLVRAVIDGDTIDVTTYGRVRLLGIDAPEIGRGFDTAAPFGKEARDRLTALVLHRWIRLEQEGPRLDVYDRHLAYLMREDGVFVNAVLVREGLARVSARLPLSRLDELKRAEAEAQASRRGMWGGSAQIPSASYTRPSGRTKTPAVSSKKPRAKAAAKKPKRQAKRRKPSQGYVSSWQRFLLSTLPTAAFVSATSFTTDSTTGRSGSSCFSSRQGRSPSICSSTASIRGWRSGWARC